MIIMTGKHDRWKRVLLLLHKRFFFPCILSFVIVENHLSGWPFQFSFLNREYFSIIRARRLSTFDNLIISALRTTIRFLLITFSFFLFSGIKERWAQWIFEQPVTRAWQNEFLFFTTGKQTRSIIARVESLTFRLAPLIITLRREVIQLSLNVDPTWSTPRVNRYARVNFTNHYQRVPLPLPSPHYETIPPPSLSSIPRKSSCLY